VTLLTLASIANASYTFLRRRHYRLFETPLSTTPTTPNASRVRVDSSPSNSPLSLVQKLIGDTSAASRSHPDATRDVWELAVWDPLPISLQLFCLFSPGHVLVYWLFLPIGNLDPRPSMTVLTTLVLELLMTAQLLLLQSNFTQQAKDTAVIHKEVLNEYDTKYVHPNLNPPVRDVGTQFSTSTSTSTDPSLDPDTSTLLISAEDVTTSTPTTILRRAFKINPNPNYARHISPDDRGASVPHRWTLLPNPVNPIFTTPQAQTSQSQSVFQAQSHRRESTPLRTAATALRQPQFRASTGTGDGGSLGVFSHANSPLKKKGSMYDGGRSREAPRNSLQAAAREIAEGRERERERMASPVRRMREEGGYEEERRRRG
jgi:hypothetical protein